jgi:hypothetical protein
VGEESGGFVPSVVYTVNVRDWDLGELLFADALQAANVDAVHLSDGRVVSDPERSNTAVLAKEVLVLPCIEEILRQVLFAGNKAKTVGLSNCSPKAISPADGAVAPVCALRQVEFGFEPYCSTVATSFIGLKHVGVLRSTSGAA